MDVARARSKFKERIVDILHFCESGSPLVFVLASAFLDYLAKLPEGKDNGAEGYKDFVAQWLMQVRPEYSSFRYASGQSDLPIQMYHVLRCGILHSFSLIPDSRARDKGGRDRSVVLIHRREAQEEGLGHLGRFASESVRDAAWGWCYSESS